MPDILKEWQDDGVEWAIKGYFDEKKVSLSLHRKRNDERKVKEYIQVDKNGNEDYCSSLDNEGYCINIPYSPKKSYFKSEKTYIDLFITALNHFVEITEKYKKREKFILKQINDASEFINDYFNYNRIGN